MILTQIKLRRGTEKEWKEDPVLAKGEPGVITDGAYSGKMKIGDGDTNWKDLPFVDNDKAPIHDPVFTGTPRIPRKTEAPISDGTRIASEAQLLSEVNRRAPTSHANDDGTLHGQATEDLFGHARASKEDPKMDGTAEVGADDGQYARGDHRHPTDTTCAPLASPAFTGVPTAPNPAATINNTQIATMAAVHTVANRIRISRGLLRDENNVIRLNTGYKSLYRDSLDFPPGTILSVVELRRWSLILPNRFLGDPISISVEWGGVDCTNASLVVGTSRPLTGYWVIIGISAWNDLFCDAAGGARQHSMRILTVRRMDVS